VESDIEAVDKYVTGDLFTRTVFLFDNKQLDEGGLLHKDYLKSCRLLLANGRLVDLNDDAVVQYMNIVWAIIKKKGRVVQSLVVKKKIKRIPGDAECIPE
jgi:hypothetical protein